MSLPRDTVVRLLVANRVPILAYIRSIVRDFDLAEDVFQEVSILAVAKRAGIQDEGHFQGWVRQAARREALSVVRKRGRSPRLLSEVALDLLDATWAEEVGTSERLETLRRCLSELTPRSQWLVEMRYRQGMKGVELAELLQRPANTVYVALSRIHRALRECLHRRAPLGGVGDA